MWAMEVKISVSLFSYDVLSVKGRVFFWFVGVKSWKNYFNKLVFFYPFAGKEKQEFLATVEVGQTQVTVVEWKIPLTAEKVVRVFSNLEMILVVKFRNYSYLWRIKNSYLSIAQNEVDESNGSVT